MTDPKHKLDTLRADLGPEADTLLPVARRLDSWAAPQPSPADTARLIESLQPALQQTSHSPRTMTWMFVFLRVQFRLIREEIWLASTLILVIGLFVTLATTNIQSTSETLPFVFIAPIITAIGVAFLYGPEVDPALEIELATPMFQRVVLLARLALVFGFNLVMSLIASVILVAFSTNLSLAALITSWLAPMAFLSALAFMLSVWFCNPLIGMLASLLLWAVQVLKSNSYFGPLPLFTQMPNLFEASIQPWLFLFAIGMGATAVWAAGHSEKWAEPAA
jgi:hypothetical protein